MAPDGRCKPFDARADGWVRGEGCGVVVLRRLAEALAAGDRVLAVIRGTAIVQDGRSTVLTAPNGAAQVEVVRAALENGNVSPDDIGYIEAHGTGTTVGDPIEFEALDEALGRSTDAAPVHIGAVKANLGHLEAAAGIAGLIKTVLVLENRHVPPQIHFSALNPLVSFEGTRLRIAAEGAAWPSETRRRFAGVSAFGFSGTNAHVVLEEAPELPARAAKTGSAHLLTISARSAASLTRITEQYVKALSTSGDLAEASLVAVCHTAGVRRHQHEHRLAVAGLSREDLVRSLESYLAGSLPWNVGHGRIRDDMEPGVPFVFSGQGSQWAGMGRVLIAHEHAAREAFDQCAEAVALAGGPSLHDIIGRDDGPLRLSSTSVAQPAIFGVQVAIAAQLKAWGIVPIAVVGHSIGEIAAAHVAGALTLHEAATIVVERSRRMEAAAGRGRMLAAGLSRTEAEALVRDFGGELAIAAVNARSSVVLSGSVEAVATCKARLAERKVSCQPLEVEYAFHSHQMVEACEGLADALATLKPASTHTPFVSTVTGAITPGEALDAAYWERNAVATVEFHQALCTLIGDGRTLFLELGPRPVLAGYVADALGGAPGSLVLGTLQRQRDDRVAMRIAAGALHVHGVTVDLQQLLPRERVVALPQYAWDRERHWSSAFDAAQRAAEGDAMSGTGVRRPFELHELETPWADRRVFETVVSAERPPYVRDHHVNGQVLLPAAAFVAVAANVAARVTSDQLAVEDVSLVRPLVLGDEDVILQVGVRSSEPAVHIFDIVSKPVSAREWTTHVTGALRADPESSLGRSQDDRNAREDAVEIVAAREFYAGLAAAGLDFGPSFRPLERIELRGATAEGQIVLPDGVEPTTDGMLHPVLLDGCFQAGWAVARQNGAPASATLVPATVGRVRLRRDAGAAVTVRVEHVTSLAGGAWSIDISARRPDGQLVATIDRLQLRPLTEPAVRRTARPDDVVPLARVAWQEASPLRVRAAGAPEAWLLFADRAGVGRRLAERLEALGHHCEMVSAATDRTAISEGLIAPTDASAIQSVLGTFVNTTSGRRHIVHLWSLDAELPHGADRIADAALERTCAATLHLLQGTARMPGSFADVTVVTRAAQTVERFEEPNPLQALAWGMSRAADLEFPDLPCRRVDLVASREDVAGVLADVVRADGDWRELAWRNGRWWAPRLDTAPAAAPPSPPVTLGISARGSFDRLRLAPRDPIAPGPGEVQIRVSASGLNFRDVLNALGMYPGDAGNLGNECVGEITAVGPGVVGFAPGDSVVAFGDSCLSTFVTTSIDRVTKRPDALSELDAATIPTTFLTADYALAVISKVQPGERVLVHAAAGGVGIAAVQLARQLGAEVYGTAGSDEKRAYVKALGAAHVGDSRKVEFADDIRRATGGRGVDVVLNSLTGPFITASLDLLGPGGRFVEIGKKDILNAESVQSRRPDVSYSVFYLGEDLERSPREVLDRLRSLLDRCARGELRPLPYRAFELERGADAFRFMARARHIGKVVLMPGRAPAWQVRPDAAYLVTGGGGAMGLHAARWLVTHGARHVVLAGRTEPTDRGEMQSLERSARIEFVRCDVAAPAEVNRLIATFGSERPPLRGMVHAAGALKDGMLVRQSWADFRVALDAKVAGTWNLHAATRRLSLDFFIAYSSIAATCGSAGQSNYCAANAFLDAFAAMRRSDGLAATSVAWGPWERGGMAAGLSHAARERQQADGLHALSDSDGDAVLDRLAGVDATHVIAARADWNALAARHVGRAALLSLVAGPESPVSQVPEIDAAPSLRDRIARLAPSDRQRALVEQLRTKVARLVGLSDERRIDEHTGFREVGLDSLLAVELRNTLQREVDGALPATLAFDFPTLAAMSTHLLDTWGLDTSATSDAMALELAALEDETAELSEEEAAALLERELDALGRTYGAN
jgi:acyl transferase domain-containing protein/NADPH:quinone reductase-like Zn-dependent oxidoreductase